MLTLLSCPTPQNQRGGFMVGLSWDQYGAMADRHLIRGQLDGVVGQTRRPVV